MISPNSIINNNNNNMQSPMLSNYNNIINQYSVNRENNEIDNNHIKMYYSPQVTKLNQKTKNINIPRNKMSSENILRQKDKRTTIMIRHIPNKYTLKLLSEEIDKCNKNQYDLLYLPVDNKNKCNLGYGFINFVNPFHIISFYDRYYGKKWEKYNSDKICELVYAKIQGKDELLQHINERGEINKCGLDVCLINDNAKAYSSKIIIPLKYFKEFVNFYQYSLYKIIDNQYFEVIKFYNF